MAKKEECYEKGETWRVHGNDREIERGGQRRGRMEREAPDPLRVSPLRTYTCKHTNVLTERNTHVSL